jgi:hypothetical protein
MVWRGIGAAMAQRRIDRTVTGPEGTVHVSADINTAVQMNTSRGKAATARSHSNAPISQSGKDHHAMTEHEMAGLSPEELEEQNAEQLPEREQMSLVNANVAAPVNAAVALNALSDGSVAYASATQDAPITQSN